MEYMTKGRAKRISKLNELRVRPSASGRTVEKKVNSICQVHTFRGRKIFAPGAAKLKN